MKTNRTDQPICPCGAVIADRWAVRCPRCEDVERASDPLFLAWVESFSRKETK